MLKVKTAKDEHSHKVIVRKKLHIADEGHHGGVWKIAYADFMTAMMTFFLVMWLTSAASKQKISQIASYFNPVRLSQRLPPARGVGDLPNSGNTELTVDPTPADSRALKPEDKPGKPDQKAPRSSGKYGDAQPQAEDEVILLNPLNKLAEISQQAQTMAAAARTKEAGPRMAASRDPFATDPVAKPPPAKTAAGGKTGADARAASPPPAAGQAETASEEAQKAAGARHTAPGEKDFSGDKSGSGDKQPGREAQEKAAQLGSEIAYLVSSLPESFRPNIETKATSEGLLISLTDDQHFTMFKIGSAVPSPQLVLVLERIGGVLGKYPGKIVIKGHTDARPYAGDSHGNWRLSLNRANMTYFMLVRGKVDELRFLSVEGHADRTLKNKADPLAGENRRIEVLIKNAGT